MALGRCLTVGNILVDYMSPRLFLFITIFVHPARILGRKDRISVAADLYVRMTDAFNGPRAQSAVGLRAYALQEMHRKVAPRSDAVIFSNRA